MKDPLLLGIVEMAALLGIAGVSGWTAAAALFPPGARFRAERAGWGLAAGLAALGVAEAATLAAGARPGRWEAAAAVVLVAAAGRFFRLEPAAPPAPGDPARWTAASRVAAAALVAGVLLYALRALTEPMWSNDFLAIWGLKGKAIFGAARIPPWLRDARIAGFSHPEYPLGLPLLFASLSTLAGRWDDQAMALLYPALQWGTLAIVFGWLRRRGAGLALAFGAAALLSLFEPLYSAFLTGMAEVPVSAAMLLLGCALSDALDGTDAGALRRLALASLLAAATKNEGLFFAAIAGGTALLATIGSPARRPRAVRAAAAAWLPALLLTAVRRAALGAAPLRDLDASLLVPSHWPDLAPRIVQALRSAASIAAPAWPVLLAVVLLLACGRRCFAGDRLLGMALASSAAYVLIPSLAVTGPDWLARASLARTVSALAPVAAAALALRFSDGGSRGPAT